MNYAAKVTWQIASGSRLDLSFFGDPSTGLEGPQPSGTTGVNDPLLRQDQAGFSSIDKYGVSLHADYGFRLSAERRVVLIADVFNVLNTNRVTDYTNYTETFGSLNPDFGQPYSACAGIAGVPGAASGSSRRSRRVLTRAENETPDFQLPIPKRHRAHWELDPWELGIDDSPLLLPNSRSNVFRRRRWPLRRSQCGSCVHGTLFVAGKLPLGLGVDERRDVPGATHQAVAGVLIRPK